MLKVLFVCVHNSARSQMAEAFFNHYAPAGSHAESAGLEPGDLNPYVVRAMAEKGIDIAAAKAKGVFALFKEGRTFSHVIAVCDAEAAQRCPIFPGVCEKLVWSFEDPSAFKGSDEAVMERVRRVRDAIETRVREFLDQPATKG